jgi:dephospho-CoA kinase
MLVGICGKAGAGKDTIADYLVKEHGFKKIALADPIKRVVQDVFVLDDHTVYDRVAREQPLEQWDGWSVRRLLQIIGTELFRKNIDEAIWVKSLLYRVQSDPTSNYVVSDVRFPNELQYLSDNSDQFFSIRVFRDGCDGVVGTKGHESEAYDLDAKYVLDNNSTFESLYEQIKEITSQEGIVCEEVA